MSEGESGRRAASVNPVTVTGRGPGFLKLEAIETAPAAAPADLELPRAIHARYEGITLIGRGGMSTVYKAHDRQLNRDVALKFLHGSEDASLRLLREARSQARLNHDNVCKVYEIGVEEGRRYIVMQYIAGVPLSELKDRIGLEDKLQIVKCVALALHEAHRLGIVHRDVKPSNILVEQLEDQSYKPYLTDFGIARDLEAHDQTATGIIAGTPAFMAPEQARGESRTIERRTDVYCLGATLYDVLSGRPPFVGDSPMAVLQKVLYDEAPPIRKLNLKIPVDIEAVLLRCLEKEQHRRYESARAVSEDLQRFLDGEPVQARRHSVAYALLRKARRNKTRVALASVAIVAALVAAILWVSTRRAALEQAKLARELGEDVKEMELFLRNASGLPLHDLERERDMVRARLQTIEQRMSAVGKPGRGPAHYALGRGHLALQEPEQALSHLRQAGAMGYVSAELNYALGLTLGEISTKALAEAKRIGDPGRKQARLAAIKTEFTEPALTHLRSALGARLEAPEFAQGLIALHAGRPEEALIKSREAFARAPWLYEAKKLEGDAHFARGSRFRYDAAFDYEKMMSDFTQAEAAYRTATEIARSDPSVYEAECELWSELMSASAVHPESLRPSFEKAKAACGRAIAASSRRASARLKLATIQSNMAWMLASGQASPEDPREALAETVAQAEAAMRQSPDDSIGPYALAQGWRAQAHYLQGAGLDERAAVTHALDGYERAIRLEPSFPLALRGLASSYQMKGVSEIHRGIDPMPSLSNALEYDRRAMKIDASFRRPEVSIISTLIIMAEYFVDVGRDPEETLQRIRDSIATAKALRPDWPLWSYLDAYAHWIKASYELAADADPSASLALGLQSANEQLKREPSSQSSNDAIGRLQATQALYLLKRGESPESALKTARDAFQRCLDVKPWDLEFRVWRARVELIGLRWLLQKDRVDRSAFAAAILPLQPLLDKQLTDPRVYQTMAELRELESRFLRKSRMSVDVAVASGLAMVDKALSINPNMAAALATRGKLLLLRASSRDAHDPARQEESASAVASLTQALKTNALLKRELEAPLREAQSLVP